MDKEKEKYWKDRLKKIQEKTTDAPVDKIAFSPSMEELNLKYTTGTTGAAEDQEENIKGPVTSNQHIKVEFNETGNEDEDLPSSLSKKSIIKLDNQELGWEG